MDNFQEIVHELSVLRKALNPSSVPSTTTSLDDYLKLSMIKQLERIANSLDIIESKLNSND